jgi:hypothetical protein
LAILLAEKRLMPSAAAFGEMKKSPAVARLCGN